MAAYAGRMTAAQFEGKCQGKALPEKTITTTKGKTPQIYNKPPAVTNNIGGFPQPPLMLPGALRPNDVPLPFNPPFSLPPPMGPGGFDPTGIGSGFIKPPVAAAPHLNPAFLQDMSTGGGNVAELFAKAAAHFQTNSTVKSRHSEEEIADANQRNRAISSSAISRAMSDANSGDYDSAIDTLKMAITLIKQSITAGSESSQVLP
jgi:cleavage and polyadenylation specificity factor subunit 6/7